MREYMREYEQRPEVQERRMLVTRREYQARRADGRAAPACARQLQRGEQIKHMPNQHRGVSAILGPRPKGMTASRTCPDDCPDSWLGYTHKRGRRADYRLCIPDQLRLRNGRGQQPPEVSLKRRDAAPLPTA
jgi:hypothetical protein